MNVTPELPDYSKNTESPHLGRNLTERQTHVPASPIPRGYQAFDEDSEDEGIDLRELWLVIARHRWTIIIFTAIIFAAVVTATYLKTPIYRASLTLQIDREELNVVNIQSVSPSYAAYYDYYQTQYELLKGRSLASRVVKHMGLVNRSPPATYSQPSLSSQMKDWFGNWFPKTEQESDSNPKLINPSSQDSRTESAVNKFLGGLTIRPVKDSRLVVLYYYSPNPKLAADILNNLAKIYINQNLERRFEATTYARNFLQERLQQIKIQLEESERALVEFARREEIITLDDNKSIISNNLAVINAGLNEARQKRITAETIYQQMLKVRGQGLTQMLDSVIIQRLKQTQAKLEAQYQDNLSIYKPAYPAMVQLHNQIRQVDTMIEQEIGNIRAAITANYKAAQAEETLLRTHFERAKQEMLALQDRSIQYNILRREADTNRELYDGLLQRFKEIGVASGVGKNNISIIDAARIPEIPFSPNMRKNALIALILGLLGGIGLAFLFEYLDDTFHKPDDVEKLTHLPVFGIIPMTRQLITDERPISLVGHDDPRSAFAEAYRSVRTVLQFSTVSGIPQLLTVTSAISGEGKSTTAVSLAIQFAQAGKRTLLIEADLRKPSLHRVLKLENQSGLTNYLAGEEVQPVDIAQPTYIANLFAIPSGPLPPNPAELLSSARMVTLLSLAAEKFDQVILDSPPLLGLADALIIGNLCQGTLLTVEMGSTSRGYVQGALKRLYNARVHVLGTILTKLDARSGDYGYYYHSSYYGEEVTSSTKRLPT